MIYLRTRTLDSRFGCLTSKLPPHLVDQIQMHFQLFGFTSLGVVIISTITFIIQTFPEFQLKDEEDDASSAEQAEKVLWAIDALVTIDELAIGFFTVEYVVRFLCSPRKWHFFKEPMNMVDFTAIIPFYLTLVLDSMEDMQGGRHYG